MVCRHSSLLTCTLLELLAENKNHVDTYDATYGVAGKQVGDLLMYGLPSNLLRTNLYSRGDINPRQLTIVPTQIKDIPFVNAYTNFMGQIKGNTN